MRCDAVAAAQLARIFFTVGDRTHSLRRKFVDDLLLERPIVAHWLRRDGEHVRHGADAGSDQHGRNRRYGCHSDPVNVDR